MSRPGFIDRRGSARDRQRRREWLLATFDPHLGPDRAACRLRLTRDCLVVVDRVTLSVDRLVYGGSYGRHNIQPACLPCQSMQGGLCALAVNGWLIESYRDARHGWERLFEEHTGRTYMPGIIQRERRRERRGGRREVTDFLEAHPPPVFRDWLVECAGARQDAVSDAGSAVRV